MSVARANIPSTKDTVSLPVFQSREGFVKAEGAVTNWFVNGVSVQTYASSSYNAGGIVPVADFLNGYINMTVSGSLTSPSAVDIYNYLVGARLNLSAPTAGAPGTAVAGAAPSCYVVIYNSSAGVAKLAAGAGVSISPNPADIAAGATTFFQIFVTSATACTIVPLSQGGVAAQTPYVMHARALNNTAYNVGTGATLAVPNLVIQYETIPTLFNVGTATFTPAISGLYRITARALVDATAAAAGEAVRVYIEMKTGGGSTILQSSHLITRANPLVFLDVATVQMVTCVQLTASTSYQFFYSNDANSSVAVDFGSGVADNRSLTIEQIVI